MAIQFIINDRGEKTSVIILIAEYESLIHQRHSKPGLTDAYKKMVPVMLKGEDPGEAK